MTTVEPAVDRAEPSTPMGQALFETKKVVVWCKFGARPDLQRAIGICPVQDEERALGMVAQALCLLAGGAGWQVRVVYPPRRGRVGRFFQGVQAAHPRAGMLHAMSAARAAGLNS